MEISYNLTDQQVLEEEYDENYEPTEEEVLEYCKVLGVDPLTEKDLLYIAREALKAPLPKEWKPIEDGKGNIYYFNFVSGASMWEHPCDEFYRRQLQQEREKRRREGVTGEGRGRRKGGGKAKKSSGKSAQPPTPVVAPSPLANGLSGGVSRGMGGTGGGLSSLGGLPPLKAPGRAGALAPLRMPPGMSHHPGGSLGASLTSTTGTGSSTLRSAVPVGRQPPIGSIELGTGAISTQFEEEDEESESDSDLRGGFQSKLGVNLLGAEDLGLEESEGEGSSRDVSRELRRVLELEGSEEEEEESEKEEEGGRIVDILHHPSNAEQVSESPKSSPRLGRPSAARGTRAPPLQSTPLFTRPLTSPPIAAIGGETPTPIMSTTGQKPTASSPLTTVTSKQSIVVSDSPPDGRTPAASDSVEKRRAEWAEELKALEEEHKSAVERLKSSHAQKLEELRGRLGREGEVEEEAVRQEHEERLVSLRRELAAEMVVEEQKLRREKEASLSTLRAKVREEEEEEEAKAHEAKEDSLRKLRQQISQEQEREERRLREEKERALRELRKQFQDQQAEEETRLRSSAATELSLLRERLGRERKEEEEGLGRHHERELQELRDQATARLQEEREEMERKNKTQMEAMAQQLRDEHEKALQELRAEFERDHSVEVARERALERHRERKEALENELSAALQAKRTELEQQHQAELDILRGRLLEELAGVREEEARKMEGEREKLAKELESMRNAVKMEHETELQRLQEEFVSGQRHFEEQREQQAREVGALQSQYQGQRAELEQLRHSVEEESSELERERRRVREEQANLRTEEERLQVLRSGSSREVEQLLQRQQGELRAAVEREKKTLGSLKRSRSSLEERVRELQKQQSILEEVVGRLREEEEACRTRLTAASEQGERESAVRAREVDSLKAPLEAVDGASAPQGASEMTQPAEEPPQQALQDSTALPPSLSPLHTTTCTLPATQLEKRVNAKSPRSEGVKVAWSHGRGEESDSSEMSVGSMRLQELDPPTAKTKPPIPVPSENGEEEGGGRRRRWEGGRGRRGRGEPLHRWSDGLKAPRSRQASGDSDRVLLRDVQSRLEQEGAALAELERRVKSSHRALAQRERTLLHTESPQSSGHEGATPHSSPPPLLDGIPSPKTYLAQLRERLEKGGASTRLTAQGLTVANPKPLRLELSGESSELSSSSSSGSELSDLERRPRLGHPYDGGGTVAARKAPRGGVGREQGEIMASLNKINSQLGQLLGRMHQPLPSYPPPLPTATPLPSYPPTLPAAVPLAEHRWANPVKFPDKTDLQLQRKRNSYIGGVAATTQGLQGSRDKLYGSSHRPATEELLRTHTDWLKEFQQSIPLSSRLGVSQGTPHHHHHTYTLPSKLTLDSRNSVRMVHAPQV